jgi:hypothetical protein
MYPQNRQFDLLLAAGFTFIQGILGMLAMLYLIVHISSLSNRTLLITFSVFNTCLLIFGVGLFYAKVWAYRASLVFWLLIALASWVMVTTPDDKSFDIVFVVAVTAISYLLLSGVSRHFTAEASNDGPPRITRIPLRVLAIVLTVTSSVLAATENINHSHGRHLLPFFGRNIRQVIFDPESNAQPHQPVRIHIEADPNHLYSILTSVSCGIIDYVHRAPIVDTVWTTDGCTPQEASVTVCFSFDAPFGGTECEHYPYKFAEGYFSTALPEITDAAFLGYKCSNFLFRAIVLNNGACVPET